jgi:Ca2+-binding EF-hand superfamily protein
MSGRYTASNARRARELAHASLLGLGGGQFNSTSTSDHRRNRNTGRNPTSNLVNGEHMCVQRLRAKIKTRGSISGIHAMGRIFRAMDNNGDKRLSKDELEWGLRDLGVTFNKAELDELFSILDRDGSGGVDFDELLRTLRGPLSPARLELISQAFEKLDVTKDGVVTLDDLERTYDASCHPKVQSGQMTCAEALREFLTQWDTLEADGIVTKQEFIEYYKNVSACVDTDEYFQAMMIKAWDLDGSTAKLTSEPRTVTVCATHVNGSVSEHEVDFNECSDQYGGGVDARRVQEALARRDITAVQVEVKGSQVANVGSVKQQQTAEEEERDERYQTSSLASRSNCANKSSEAPWQPKVS